MLKKGINIFISIILLLPLFIGVGGFSQMINNGPPSFQKTCDMDHCNPYTPKCPLCPSSSSIVQFFHQDMSAFPPIPSSSITSFTVSTLSDQGFVKAIFHPPTA
jgi:hypothetical protein